MSPHPLHVRVLQDRAFLLLLVTVSLAFGWILRPYYGAIFWATVLAILFAPLHRRLCVLMYGRRALSALATVTVILMLVILPAALIAASLLQEAFGIYARVQSDELSFTRWLRELVDTLPDWAMNTLDRFGLTDLGALEDKLAAGMVDGIQFLAPHAFDVGQSTLRVIVGFFVMLYLLFYLLRDGGELWRRIRHAIPLNEELQRELSAKFAAVIRATVKGDIVVAVLQGALGGLIFWVLNIGSPVLLAVLMGFLSLLPAVGTGLVWLPVAIFLIATGAVWQGVVLIAYGTLVIGLVDNILRPVLIGKDTKLPDYVVLLSTLGGLAVFGLNGFVIGPVIAAMFMAVWGIVAAYRTADAGQAAE